MSASDRGPNRHTYSFSSCPKHVYIRQSAYLKRTTYTLNDHSPFQHTRLTRGATKFGETENGSKDMTHDLGREVSPKSPLGSIANEVQVFWRTGDIHGCGITEHLRLTPQISQIYIPEVYEKVVVASHHGLRIRYRRRCILEISISTIR